MRNLNSITDHYGNTYLYDNNGNIDSYRDKHGIIYDKVGKEIAMMEL
ncbi:hypothetical protein [Nonlabens sp. Asnod3-A02]